MVELMVVVAIITLLLLIGMPSALMIQKNVARGTSLVRLGTIETALKAYSRDFDGAYPPSNPKGGETLCRLLTGYPNDPDGNREPGADPRIDDGCDGFGFRLPGGGNPLGPYSGAEDLPKSGGSEIQFVDAFQQPILYYLYRGGTYTNADNVDGPTNVADYALSGGVYYRKDYLLITRGPDGDWTRPRDGGDDITNFK